MATTTHTSAPALFSGDWLYDAERDGYSRVYEGVRDGRWSGGVEFLASRAVAEEIVRDQERFCREQAEAFPDNPDILNTLRWDGDELVLGTGGSDEETRYPPDEQGRYPIGFGWIWDAVDDDERFFEVVRDDGTVQQNELDHDEAVMPNGCTGYRDEQGRLLHDGDTCPIHETDPEFHRAVGAEGSS